jgi:hypothetical protein
VVTLVGNYVAIEIQLGDIAIEDVKRKLEDNTAIGMRTVYLVRDIRGGILPQRVVALFTCHVPIQPVLLVRRRQSQGEPSGTLEVEPWADLHARVLSLEMAGVALPDADFDPGLCD